MGPERCDRAISGGFRGRAERAGDPATKPTVASSLTRIETTFRNVHQQLKPRTRVPRIEARFFPSVAANHSASLAEGQLKLRISDLFHDAPGEVLEALAVILLSRLYRKKVNVEFQRRYRQYLLSPGMLERSRETRQSRGRPRRRTGPVGRHYDLEQLFSEINLEYFGNRLRRPALSWTDRPSKSVLGRYEFDDDVILLSISLDSPRIPAYVVRFVLFHEMLHVKYGTEIRGIREIVHPPEFRKEERKFVEYELANSWLDSHQAG